jgi:hypothetical protein
MPEMRTDTKAAKGLAAGLVAAILAAELLHDAALPEHSPHGDPARPDPALRTVAGGGSVEGRPITWLNDLGKPVQLVNDRGEPVTVVANGRPSDPDGLELPAARE